MWRRTSNWHFSREMEFRCRSHIPKIKKPHITFKTVQLAPNGSSRKLPNAYSRSAAALNDHAISEYI